MSEAKSKRSYVISEESIESSTIENVMTEKEFEDLVPSLPQGKKLKVGRKYLKRKSKRRSEYWNDYLEYIEDGVLRAECKYCDKTFAADPNVNGSKNVKNHSERCVLNPANKGKGKQSILALDTLNENEGTGEAKVKSWVLNLNVVRDALNYMIIVDELPFRFVEKVGFKYLMSVCCPQFVIPSRVTVVRDCLKRYELERAILKNLFASSCQRVCVTTDTWTSIQRVNYMCLTAHFIDNDWNLHKRILNFCPITSHKGQSIAKAVEMCLEKWGLDSKLYTVTVDNVSSNDVACENLKKLVERTSGISKGKYLHVRCIAHIINLIVWSGLGDKNHIRSIDRVRSAVKYIRNSPARLHRFEEISKKLRIECKSSLSQDVCTRWNSTFEMLDVALKFQRVFSYVDLPCDEDVPDSEMPVEESDWKNIEKLVVFLKGFYGLTTRISGSLYLTSNKAFFEIAAAFNLLRQWEKSTDKEFQSLAISMKQKFDKYWGDINKMNMLTYMGVIFDPEYKMLGLEVTLVDMYGKVEGQKLVESVEKALTALYEEYKIKYAPNCGQSDSFKEHTRDDVEDGGGADYMRLLQDRVKRKKGSGGGMSELERYFNDQVEDDYKEVLTWWKLNEFRFPILAKMARDVLAVPFSTVASESAFSTGGRTIDPFRSSLSPKMVQALICCQDWLRAHKVEESKGKEKVNVEENLQDLHEYEKDMSMNSVNEFDIEEDMVYVDF